MLRRALIYLRWRPEDRRSFRDAWFSLLLATVALRLLGLDRSLALLRARRAPAAITQDEIDVLAAWVQFAARKIPGSPRCLECSLALLWQLRRRGVECELTIGVKQNGSLMEAHAWLERGGTPVSESIGISAEFSVFKPIAAVS